MWPNCCKKEKGFLQFVPNNDSREFFELKAGVVNEHTRKFGTA